jgi:hypothetical protein
VTGPIAVPDDTLHAHAANVEAVADRVRMSRQAAQATQLDRGSYGQLCQFMVAFFEPSMQITVEGLSTSVEELGRVVGALRSTGTGFGQADATASTAVDGPRLRLPL